MTDSFISQREKQQKKKFFRDKANKKVRMNNFLKAMKTQYGPNVEMFGEDAIRVDKDDSQTVVGNYSDFLESGGQLQGTPVTAEDLKIKKKKPKFENAVVKDENSEAFDAAQETVNTNRSELNIADMEKYSNNNYDLLPSPNPNTNVSEMAFRGTDSASFDAVRSKIAKDPSRIQKELMESGFTADRLANLVIANKKFQANKRKKR
tara:strand:- start:73 stop:690 length:618 start_codon:yes stop_codon:yes gene_type:complete